MCRCCLFLSLEYLQYWTAQAVGGNHFRTHSVWQQTIKILLWGLTHDVPEYECFCAAHICVYLFIQLTTAIRWCLRTILHQTVANTIAFLRNVTCHEEQFCPKPCYLVAFVLQCLVRKYRRNLHFQFSMKMHDIVLFWSWVNDDVLICSLVAMCGNPDWQVLWFNEVGISCRQE